MKKESPGPLTFMKKKGRWDVIIIQVHLGDISGLVPDHHNKVTLKIKRVIIFLLRVGLAFDL